MTKTRYSKQRELILNNLKNRHDHPSAELVYNDLKKENPNLSLGTVYRNLNFLADAKMIRKLDIGEQFVHFDGDISDHQHFICQECNEVYDINVDISDIIKDKVDTNHSISNVNVTMSGICENCLKKKN